jgi:hypothetical protein
MHTNPKPTQKRPAAPAAQQAGAEPGWSREEEEERGLQSYLADTYVLTGGTIAVMAVGSMSGVAFPALTCPWMTMAVSLDSIPFLSFLSIPMIPVIPVAVTLGLGSWLLGTTSESHSELSRTVLLASFGFTAGVATAPFVATTLSTDPLAVSAALCGVIGPLSAVALGTMAVSSLRKNSHDPILRDNHKIWQVRVTAALLAGLAVSFGVDVSDILCLSDSTFE